MDDIKLDLIDVALDTTQEAGDEKQIQVRFTPARSARYLPSTPTTFFSVPITLGRVGLSELVNHLLELKPNKTFEFLIQNKFLRTTLEKYLQNHNLSLEDELELEYLEATPPPDRDQSTPHPDWVSSIDSCLGVVQASLPNEPKITKDTKDTKEPKQTTYSNQESLLSVVGCYDHLVRIWAHSMNPAMDKGTFQKSTQSLIAQGAGHLGPVTSVRVARPFSKALPNANALVLSGSHDKTLRLWELSRPVVEKNERTTTTTTAPPKASKLSCLGIFDYHVGSVTNVETRFHPNRPNSLVDQSLASVGGDNNVRFLSSGYDGAIALWQNSFDYRIPQEEVEEKFALVNKGMGRKLKAQKTHALQSAAKVTTIDEELTLPHYKPMTAYMGHRGAVTSLIWQNENNFYSGGYDTTIRLWDIERSQYIHAWSGGHVVNCMDFSMQLNLIASGDQDGYVRLWDPRVNNNIANNIDSDDDDEESQKSQRLPTTRTNKGQFKACDNWVSSVRFTPTIANTPYYMITTGYDGKSKLWDIRSSKPLHIMDTNSERLLCGDIVPTNAAGNGSHQVDVFSVCGGTGRQVDRLHWNLYTAE
jgi:ribosome biogenesis protein YTM1